MVDMRIASIDLTVLGGPSRVDLDVDFGTPGPRGSRIFGLTADPRLLTTPKPIEIKNYDLGIVINSSAPDYLTVYQKVGATLEDWEQFAALYPNFYATREAVTFDENGEGSFEIIVSEVFTLGDVFIDNPFAIERFMVQAQIQTQPGQTQRPSSVGMGLSIRAEASSQILTISLKAVEFNGTTWVPITGQRLVHSFSTVI